ncbi:MAG: 1-deoxy-D-xylulose-5-phosphate synthase [Lachnospiraceae bacterium]|nr:1-deoxy-D-xylulose-5-phosphate synthase [Lachnospiraceae bacterium]MDD7177383.1 1-deoxy-D-xylulose-5-phosphate synthase [bacterium]MDY5518354.1 1-deoxy-D-xylulose-5-phosphate synthase [Lachnospiraceae bacterium]
MAFVMDKLNKIEKINDIKKLSPSEYEPLAQEIREFLIEKVSVHGGHLASNLGVVELTMALHLAFDMEHDQLIWDVGHQSYTHKILSGRKEGFDTLREFHGMSGFPKRHESPADAFDTGHSSTSISAGLGLAVARDLCGDTNKVISVIGDGALTGGMAFEAMNNAAKLDTNFIIVLNDNEMSISHNVGGMSQYLDSIRTADSYQELKNDVMDSLQKIPIYGERMVKRIRKTKSSIKQLFIPGMLFENMGLTYLGPVDGHNIQQLIRTFKKASRVNGAVIVHVITKKGRGYLPAERHPARFHGTGAFEVETGLPVAKKTKADYTDVFASVMNMSAKENDRLVAITAAMETGTGLKRFHNQFPERFFDVGIAEEHAVTFAAGLATRGLIPVVAIYSTFLQRAYDQILHDVCLQNLHVIFAVDRAGIVGSDGETHQGIFDISYLMTIPGLVLMAPKNKWELADMLRFAFDYDGPIAIRYPRGAAYDGLKEFRAPIVLGKSEVLYDETDIALLAYGSMIPTALAVREELKDMHYQCSLINARFAKPLDEELLLALSEDHKLLVTLEENVITGGFGQQVTQFLTDTGQIVKVLQIAIPDEFVEQGSVDRLHEETGLDVTSIVKRIIVDYIGM